MSNDAQNPADPEGSELVGEYVRILLRGKVWYGNYQIEGVQKRISLRTSNKKRATLMAKRIDSDLAAGTSKPAIVTPTVAAVTAAYWEKLKADDLAPKTLAKYDMLLKRIAALAEERRVRDAGGLDLAFVDAYRAMPANAGAKPKTVYGETVFLRQVERFAVSRKMVPDDPSANLRNKKPRPSRQPCWSAGEVAQILAAATADLRPVFTLLAETRMRFGELQWLTGDDVDLNLKNPEICIRAKDRWRPKTRDQRTIPVSLVAKEVLQSMPRKWRWVVTMPRSKAVPVEGRQWTERRLLGALKRVLKGLGLVGKLHTLRHYFVSDALLNGVPQPIAQEWAGHLDPTVLEMYTHVNRKDSQAAMEHLSEAKSNLQKPKETKDGKKPDSAQS